MNARFVSLLNEGDTMSGFVLELIVSVVRYVTYR